MNNCLCKYHLQHFSQQQYKKGFRSFAAGGKLACFGTAAMSGKNLFGKVKAAIGFGFYHPAMLMVPSKTVIRINILRIAHEQPLMIKRSLEAVVQLTC